jgi:hypothetical protein
VYSHLHSLWAVLKWTENTWWCVRAQCFPYYQLASSPRANTRQRGEIWGFFSGVVAFNVWRTPLNCFPTFLSNIVLSPSRQVVWSLQYKQRGTATVASCSNIDKLHDVKNFTVNSELVSRSTYCHDRQHAVPLTRAAPPRHVPVTVIGLRWLNNTAQQVTASAVWCQFRHRYEIADGCPVSL